MQPRDLQRAPSSAPNLSAFPEDPAESERAPLLLPIRSRNGSPLTSTSWLPAEGRSSEVRPDARGASLNRVETRFTPSNHDATARHGVAATDDGSDAGGLYPNPPWLPRVEAPPAPSARPPDQPRHPSPAATQPATPDLSTSTAATLSVPKRRISRGSGGAGAAAAVQPRSGDARGAAGAAGGGGAAAGSPISRAYAAFLAQRRRTVVLINLVSIMERMDEQIVPALSRPLGCAFRAGPHALGLITFARALVQAVASPLGGLAGHFFDRVTVLFVGCAIWGFFCTAFSFATTVNQGIAAWAFNGVGLSLIIPNSQSLIADYYTATQRGEAFGTLMLTGAAGGMLGAIFATNLGGMTPLGMDGWRLAFMAVGAVSLAIGAFTLLLAVDPTRTTHRRRGTGAGRAGAGRRHRRDRARSRAPKQPLPPAAAGAALPAPQLGLPGPDMPPKIQGTHSPASGGGTGIRAGGGGGAASAWEEEEDGPTDRDLVSESSEMEPLLLTGAEWACAEDVPAAADTETGLAGKAATHALQPSPTRHLQRRSSHAGRRSSGGSGGGGGGEAAAASADPWVGSAGGDGGDGGGGDGGAAVKRTGRLGCGEVGVEVAGCAVEGGGYESAAAAASAVLGSRGGGGRHGAAPLTWRRIQGMITTPTFLIIILQGIVGSTPWNALVFLTLYLQLLGFSDRAASGLMALFLGGTAAGALVGGWLGDRVAERFPNHGRIALVQFSVGIGVPLSVVIMRGLPVTATAGSAVLYGSTMLLKGVLTSWAAPACNNPVFAEIVPPDMRNLVYAFDRSFEGALSALGAPLVGMAAERWFGFTGVAAGEGSCAHNNTMADAPPPDLAKARALGDAMLLFMVVPWSLCALFYTGLHWSYPRDRARALLPQVDIYESGCMGAAGGSGSGGGDPHSRLPGGKRAGAGGGGASKV